jgi:dTDP-4-amino-4,6-dideoxygalactose transaminase
VIGVNSRLDELQAAMLNVKLAHLDRWNARRREVANRYSGALLDLSQLTLPAIDHDRASTWHLYVVRHPERDDFMARLGAAGISTLIHYPVPPHRQPPYEAIAADADLPIAELLAREILSLPLGPHLSDDDVDRVIDGVRRCA